MTKFLAGMKRHCVFLAGAAGAIAALLAGPSARADYADGAAAAAKLGTEAGIRVWRRSAWQDDDFFSEIRLGDIYGNDRAKFYDPVEAYVWYYLASHSVQLADIADNRSVRAVTADMVRRAWRNQQRLMILMDPGERRQAHDRIVYILSCSGSRGFVKLGQLVSSDPDGDSDQDASSDRSYTYSGLSDWSHARRSYYDRAERESSGGDLADMRRKMGLSSTSLITPDDSEALVYFHIAKNMGHPLAGEYVRGLERELRRSGELGQRIITEADDKAHYWFPPYEFYPTGENPSGLPYSDECYMNADREAALAIAHLALPPGAIWQALRFLGWRVTGNGLDAARSYQRSLGHEATGFLSDGEMVRLVQTAAVRGDASSQNSLGVMYAKGVGVTLNYARAAYWFGKASDQRFGAALYHLGVLYKVGPRGVIQDISKANDFFTAAALAGFRPGMNQLRELLAHAGVGAPANGRN